jgi:hypothetical protein
MMDQKNQLLMNMDNAPVPDHNNVTTKIRLKSGQSERMSHVRKFQNSSSTA